MNVTAGTFFTLISAGFAASYNQDPPYELIGTGIFLIPACFLFLKNKKYDTDKYELIFIKQNTKFHINNP